MTDLERIQVFRERDRLWCAALIDVLSLDQTIDVLAHFNKHRPDKEEQDERPQTEQLT